MKYTNFLMALALSLAFISCGVESSSSESASSNSDMEQAPKDLEEAINKSAKALEDVFKGDGEKVDIVNWRELKDFLPGKVNGLNLNGDIDGQTSKMLGLQFSSVEATYKEGAETVSYTHLTLPTTSRV